MLLIIIADLGSGVFVGLLGVAYFADIHHLAYYVVVQVFVGIFEVKNNIVMLPSYFCIVYRLAWHSSSDG